MKNQESRFGINIGPFIICRRKQLEERLIKAEEKAFKRIYGSGKPCTGEYTIPVEDIEDYRRIHGGTIENAALKLLPTTDKKDLSKFLARNARVHCDRIEIVGEYVKVSYSVKVITL